MVRPDAVPTCSRRSWRSSCWARLYPTLLGSIEDLRRRMVLLEQVGPDLLTEWPPGP
ncbi:hypothetical protein ACFVWN_11620 [Nocardiopsis flavescens]|uniref:hypothetical protein n=1 Tax=Nocardiopsis flavescens TaxID=758803 RepID=UPI003669A6D7